MSDAELEGGYPGIGRLQYFLAQIVMIAVAVFVVTVFGPESFVMLITTLVLLIASFVLDTLRLRNIGVSQWWAFLRYVPLGKTLLGMALLCAQPGWAETRQLDNAGKSILTVELVLLAMILLLFLRSGITVFGFPPDLVL